MKGAQPRIPRATYRLQFNRGFTFSQAEEILDYLNDIGISDIYASPLFKTGDSSTHGYDVCGFDQINPNLGGEEGLRKLAKEISARGMGLLLDMVPNHMGADLCNDLWHDVLENGRFSPYAEWFDIYWEGLSEHGRVLVPTLEDHYSAVLEGGKLQAVYDSGRFAIAYYDRKFPVCPECYASLADELRHETLPEELQLPLRTLLLACKQLLRDRSSGVSASTAVSMRELFASARLHLRTLVDCSPQFEKALQSMLRRVNGQVGVPDSFDMLDRLIRNQHYRLCYWRVGSEEINYRRFFDVTTLVSLRMERRDVFEGTHKLVLDLFRSGCITGLRIDHPDGLRDPAAYFEWLQSEKDAQPRYVVVEKILTGAERLPLEWPVAGTTGYDFLNQLNGIFINTANSESIDNIYRGFTGIRMDFEETFLASKKRILARSLISELNRLAGLLRQVARGTRYGLDLTLSQLHEVLTELIAAFPVYRTYIGEHTSQIGPADRAILQKAFSAAKNKAPAIEASVWDFIRGLLELQWPSDFSESTQKLARSFVLSFQQLTGPVMAKGLEDTAFYNFNRLISLNEVGGAPEKFGVLAEEFHVYNKGKAAHWPHGLVATATHDTKRGEDIRARINVLSEMPEEWRHALTRWSALNADIKKIVDDEPAPHPNEEYLLYQTLIGCWENKWESAEWRRQFRARVVEYMVKAIREAKARTGWKNPKPEYESATQFFVEDILRDEPNPFLQDFRVFQQRVAFFGKFNSLSQALLKMVCPGVPDFYQGTELWDYSLVDPDNRRPVDYAQRRQLLSTLKNLRNGWAGADAQDLSKFWVIYQTLALRRRVPGLFSQGHYVPLLAKGSRQEHLCALARLHEGQCAIAAVPRLIFGLCHGREVPPSGQVWEDTLLALPSAIPQTNYRDVITGRVSKLKDEMLVSELLSGSPVALLMTE